MATFDLEAWLPTQKQRVEQVLQSHMADVARRTPPRLAEAMQYSLFAGGKRLRPILCLAFADAAAQASRGGGPMGDDAAFALECVHTYSLIHDDLPSMDDDDLRRGRPTNHKVFGEAMAILAGDALLTEAFGALARGTGGDPALRARLVAELAAGAGAGGMVGGQVLDIAPDRPAEEAYLTRLHRMKTGALIRAACAMGVIAARGDDRALAAAETYGDAVGLGFQIADDVLDVSSSAEVMGKPVAADAAKGRFTYPAVIGLERARALAEAQAHVATQAALLLEPEPGPLAALARYAVERES
jgi:geranylgeranyl diphosphate synthase type II